ncbi:hypothetical protein D3C76_626640 [compost metagenome]
MNKSAAPLVEEHQQLLIVADWRLPSARRQMILFKPLPGTDTASCALFFIGEPFEIIVLLLVPEPVTVKLRLRCLFYTSLRSLYACLKANSLLFFGLSLRSSDSDVLLSLKSDFVRSTG